MVFLIFNSSLVQHHVGSQQYITLMTLFMKCLPIKQDEIIEWNIGCRHKGSEKSFCLDEYLLFPILRDAEVGLVYYCKSGNFRVTFISQIFNFRIISEFLNSRACTHSIYKGFSKSLLART